MSYNPNHNMPPCGRPPQHSLTFGELNYTAEQINALLGMIPFKADRAEVPEMEKLSDVNYLGHVTDPSLLTPQTQPSWALVGSLKECRPYFYYVEGFVPQGYTFGWNDVSSALGTYDITVDKVSIYDFSLVTEYNVSNNHTHTAKIFNSLSWKAIPYRSWENTFIKEKIYRKGDYVNMPGYTQHSFRASSDVQYIAPFDEKETNAFTFEEAITIVPVRFRIPGMKVIFVNRMSSLVDTFLFRGEDASLWMDYDSWQHIDYTRLTEVYNTNLLDRFASYEDMDGANVTEQDLQEISRITKAIKSGLVVSTYYNPDKSSTNYYGTLDCYVNDTYSEFGCYITTEDGLFIARCNVRQPGKWVLKSVSNGGDTGTGGSYNSLSERPKINGTLLTGNLSYEDLGIASQEQVEALDKIVNPLSVSVSGGGLFEFGTTQNITVKWATTKAGTTVTPEETLVNGESVTGTSKAFTVSETTKFSVHVRYKGADATGSTTATFIAAMRFGFNASSVADESVVVSFAKQPLKTSPNGSYTLAASTNGYMWLCVPDSMKINKVTMSGFDVPMEQAQDLVVGGANFKCYRSSNQLVSGTYIIVVS